MGALSLFLLVLGDQSLFLCALFVIGIFVCSGVPKHLSKHLCLWHTKCHPLVRGSLCCGDSAAGLVPCGAVHVSVLLRTLLLLSKGAETQALVPGHPGRELNP